MKTNHKRQTGSMTLKLDMFKAYDRIEWSFLEAIIKKLGFGGRWISLIMNYVTNITWSIIVNGQTQGMFKPERGIR